MKCPFCGEDMVPGAMQTKRIRIMDWEYRWLPPAEERPEHDGRETLPEPARVLLEKVERRWKVSSWDEEKAVELRPAKEGEQGLEGMLLSGNICYEGAWYCPKCEKALWLLERAPEGLGWPESEEPEQREKTQDAEYAAMPDYRCPSCGQVGKYRRCPFCGASCVPEAQEQREVEPTVCQRQPEWEKPSKPRDDPWEEKGFFRRRKKPDWEK